MQMTAVRIFTVHKNYRILKLLIGGFLTQNGCFDHNFTKLTPTPSPYLFDVIISKQIQDIRAKSAVRISCLVDIIVRHPTTTYEKLLRATIDIY